MQIQADTLQVILNESVDMSAVSWDLCMSEIASADLSALVNMSDLKSRDQPTEALEDLFHATKAAGKSLGKLDSSSRWAVDR